MTRLKDWLAWGAARLGWPGLSGLALVLGAVATCLVLVRPMADTAVRLQDQASAMARRPAEPTASVAVQDWRGALPPDHQAYGRLTRLFLAAKETGLALDEGNYRTQTEAHSGLARLVINFPVSGDYPAIRAFLAQALNQDAALALENVKLSRDAMGETELVADLRFALYLGARP